SAPTAPTAAAHAAACAARATAAARAARATAAARTAPAAAAAIGSPVGGRGHQALLEVVEGRLALKTIGVSWVGIAHPQCEPPMNVRPQAARMLFTELVEKALLPPRPHGLRVQQKVHETALVLERSRVADGSLAPGFRDPDRQICKPLRDQHFAHR